MMSERTRHERLSGDFSSVILINLAGADGYPIELQAARA